MFSEELRKEITALIGRYETKRSSILPIFHAIQKTKGWIDENSLRILEEEYSFLQTDLKEVLTFYTMYRQEKPKPARVEVCNSISCWLRGSGRLINDLKTFQKLDFEKNGKTSIEIHEVGCLGICGAAPAAIINDQRHINLSTETAINIINKHIEKEKSCL